MFDDSFTQIEHGDAAKILDQLNPLLDGSPFDPSIVRMLGHDLPFYKGYQLIEVSDYDVNPPRQISFLYKEGSDLLILNGTNEPIYQLNKSAPIQLNEAQIFLYVRFFFYYVRGRFGRFHIVENVDEIDWKEEPIPTGKKALSKMVQPLSLQSTNEEDSDFYLKASVIFKDSLFESDILVTPNGDVRLSNQELLVEDIPVLDDSFGQ